MRIAVFGATGRTGRPLVEQALGRGHEVVLFVRDATGLRSTVREDDRVSVLGQPSDGPDDLLTEAGRHVLTAMGLHGVERFVTLVGAGVRDEDESVSLGGRVMDTLLKLVARSVLEDAQDHVEMVRASDTRWTVVRGPRLTEGPHTGEFRHGTALSLGMRDTAARANVAEFIIDCLEDDLYVHEMPKIADT